MAVPSFLSGGFIAAAHRGASRDFPENTIEAFRRAREIIPGCMLETDARLTADGCIVLMHDAMLDPKTGGRGPVRRRTLAEIKSLEAGHGITFDGGTSFPFRGRGYRIAALPEFLEAFPAAAASIDIKDNDPAAAGRVISDIKNAGAEGRILVGSFHYGLLRLVRRLHPGIITSFSTLDTINMLARQRLGVPNKKRWEGAALLIPEFAGRGIPEYNGGAGFQGVRVITPGLVRFAHGAGIPVLAWTINGAGNMRRLIEWGVNGIITDRPEVLADVMRGKNGVKALAD